MTERDSTRKLAIIRPLTTDHGNPVVRNQSSLLPIDTPTIDQHFLNNQAPILIIVHHHRTLEPVVIAKEQGPFDVSPPPFDVDDVSQQPRESTFIVPVDTYVISCSIVTVVAVQTLASQHFVALSTL
ncbi:hypothetical protein L1987_24950 [Smallanthus sonchifolius]|uniref:Uncharacterized protein n=1 Tax=Smallanthus sonchifolius TaxID=185202 RepID=A0ACB9IMG4_9ASTR|nr:hypothetical protein L1987_24950 [Smallanthus sonchifolius]